MRAILLTIVVIHLLVKPVKELTPRETLKDKVDLVAALVHLLQADNIRVIKLDENLNLLAELLQSLLTTDMTKVKALDCVQNACFPML